MANNQNTQLATALIQILVQYGPAVYASAVDLAHKSDPTREDFLSLLDSIGKETYEDFIAQARAARGLPPAPAPTPVG